MTAGVLGALIGGACAVGVVLVIVATTSRMSVRDRVLPFVRAASPSNDLYAPDAAGLDWVGTASARAFALDRALRLLGSMWSNDSVTRRLEQAGMTPDVELFRLRQLRWASIGALGVLVFGLLRAATGKPPTIPVWVVLIGLAAICGAGLADLALSKAAHDRSLRITEELPAFAELLAFAVAAGLPPAIAINRVAARNNGELASELRRCTDEIAQGRPMNEALEAMATRANSPAVQRFVDGIVVATQRGTPLTEVMRAQAMDARAAGHRSLMESMGKREIYAMIPVVFLILPIVVVIAVFPGFAGLVINVP